MKKKFELGQLVTTANVDNQMLENKSFYNFVCVSLGRYMKCDWGDTCKEDAKQNDAAIVAGDRILAVYKHGDTTIWIITEWDRSATTILFPEDY